MNDVITEQEIKQIFKQGILAFHKGVGHRLDVHGKTGGDFERFFGQIDHDTIVLVRVDHLGDDGSRLAGHLDTFTALAGKKVLGDAGKIFAERRVQRLDVAGVRSRARWHGNVLGIGTITGCKTLMVVLRTPSILRTSCVFGSTALELFCRRNAGTRRSESSGVRVDTDDGQKHEHSDRLHF